MTQKEIRLAADYCRRLHLFIMNGIVEYFDDAWQHIILMPQNHKRALQIELQEWLYKYRQYFCIAGRQRSVTFYNRNLAKLPE